MVQILRLLEMISRFGINPNINSQSSTAVRHHTSCSKKKLDCTRVGFSKWQLTCECFQGRAAAAGTSAAVHYSRYPSGDDAMTRLERTQYVAGHLHRIIDGTMFEDSVETAVLLLSKEVVSANWPLETVERAMRKVLGGIRKVWCEKALRDVLGTFDWMMSGF